MVVTLRLLWQGKDKLQSLLVHLTDQDRLLSVSLEFIDGRLASALICILHRLLFQQYVQWFMWVLLTNLNLRTHYDRVFLCFVLRKKITILNLLSYTKMTQFLLKRLMEESGDRRRCLPLFTADPPSVKLQSGACCPFLANNSLCNLMFWNFQASVSSGHVYN